MGVVAGSIRTWGGDMDTEAVGLFLRGQCSCLQRGLERAEDETAVAIVLRSHEACHGAWLSLIAALERPSPAAAALVANLYNFHGRVVGSLERGPDLRLDAGLRADVRRLLGDRLATLTEETLGAVQAAAVTAIAPPPRG